MVIGQEHQCFLAALATRLDPAQQMGTPVLGARLSEPNRFVGQDAAVLRRRMLLDYFVAGVALHAGHEVHPVRGPVAEQHVVVVPPVIDHDRARRERDLMGDLDVGHRAFGDDAEARQVAIVIQHQMQLHRTFGTRVPRPIEHRQAQLDQRRIQADQFVLEAELAPRLPPHLGRQRGR